MLTCPSTQYYDFIKKGQRILEVSVVQFSIKQIVTFRHLPLQNIKLRITFNGNEKKNSTQQYHEYEIIFYGKNVLKF